MHKPAPAGTRQEQRLSAPALATPSSSLPSRPQDHRLLQQAQQLLSRGQAAPALSLLQSLGEASHSSDAQYLIGLCHQAQGQASAAVQAFANVLEREPHRIAAYVQLAHAMAQLGHQGQARAFIEQALGLFPGQAQLLHTQAQLMVQEGLLLQACKVFEHLESSGQADLPCRFEYAELLHKTRQNEPALALYERILQAAPKNLQAMNNMANVLCSLQRHQEALAVYERLLKISPKDFTALKNVATIHFMLRDFVQSYSYYQRAYHLRPQERDIAGAYWYALAFICDWHDHDKVRQQLLQDERFGQARPLTACLFTDDPARLLGHARHLAETQFKPSNVLGPLPARSAKGKIRLGYFSSDFYTHATVMLIRGLIAAHDRERFEVHAFSLQPTRADEGHHQIRGLFDHFHEVHALSDRAVALLARQQEIDIAIDLKGYTEGCRPQIFAERAAPLQVNFLGYPGSMGASFMDAIVADPYVVPPGQEAHYTEQVLRMPHCYQPNDPGRPKPTGQSPRPAELPPGAFVFCCFNNTHKISPELFACWMRILQKTPNSVLWLLKTNDAARDNLLAQAHRAGVDSARIVFAPFLPEGEHLERLSHADLFLDTFPYNAHTSASDAVWAGVPVLTRSGSSFASRVAGSILRTLGMDELITDQPSDYETLAAELAANPERLQALHRRLKAAIQDGPLYDAQDFARHLEQLLLLASKSADLTTSSAS